MYADDPDGDDTHDDGDPKRWVIHGDGKQETKANPEGGDGVDGVHQAMAGMGGVFDPLVDRCGLLEGTAHGDRYDGEKDADNEPDDLVGITFFRLLLSHVPPSVAARKRLDPEP